MRNGWIHDFAERKISSAVENIALTNTFQSSVQNCAASHEFLKQYQPDKYRDDDWYSFNLMWREIYPSIRRASRKNNESWWCIFGIHKHKPVDESDIMLVCERCGHAKIDYKVLLSNL